MKRLSKIIGKPFLLSCEILSVDHAYCKASDDYDAEDDAVDSECSEVSSFDVAHQELDDSKRYPEGCQGAEGEDYEFA